MAHKNIIALTGGIGSGKSAAADFFKQLGVEVIDTDQIARDLVAPGQPALQAIANHLGKDILTAEATLNRRKLREIIFADPKHKEWLESMLHPLINAETRRQVTQTASLYCIVAIPLLVESHYPQKDLSIYNRVLMVDIDEELQLQRTSQRDQSPTEHIQQIIKLQAKRNQRLAIADDVIVNNAGLDALQQQVEILHQFYIDQFSAQKQAEKGA